MFRRIPALFFLLVLPAVVFAQAPLIINGIADRATYSDAASFSIPVTAGYSYAVTLDGARVPPVLTNLVNAVDYHEMTAWRTNTSTGAVTNRTVRFIVQGSSVRQGMCWACKSA